MASKFTDLKILVVNRFELDSGAWFEAFETVEDRLAQLHIMLDILGSKTVLDVQLISSFTDVSKQRKSDVSAPEYIPHTTNILRYKETGVDNQIRGWTILST